MIRVGGDEDPTVAPREREERWVGGAELRAGATILMMLGVPDPIVRKLTGHRSRELERYQHLTPELRAMTVNLISTELFRAKQAKKTETGTPTGTVRKTRPAGNRARREVLHSRGVDGGVDGTRARDAPEARRAPEAVHHDTNELEERMSGGVDGTRTRGLRRDRRKR